MVGWSSSASQPVAVVPGSTSTCSAVSAFSTPVHGDIKRSHAQHQPQSHTQLYTLSGTAGWSLSAVAGAAAEVHVVQDMLRPEIFAAFLCAEREEEEGGDAHVLSL